jgi:parallel beta-helix repeat protein
MIKDVIINSTSTGLLVVFTNVVLVTESEFSNNHMGVFLYYSTQCAFRRNNFIKNVIHSRFTSEGLINSKSNLWRNNYWQNIIGSETRLFKRMPRKITGICHLKNRLDRFRLIPFIIVREYDIRPARFPYVIS